MTYPPMSVGIDLGAQAMKSIALKRCVEIFFVAVRCREQETLFCVTLCEEMDQCANKFKKVGGSWEII